MDIATESFEVQLPAETLQSLQQEAERRAALITELVREAIDLLLAQDTEARLQAVEALCQVEAPVANWKQMKKEIEEARRP